MRMNLPHVVDFRNLFAIVFSLCTALPYCGKISEVNQARQILTCCMGIRFCAKLLENRKSQSKNLWRKWSWFRSAVRRLPFYFLRSKDAVDILFRKKKTNEVYFATLNLLEFCAGRSSIGGQDGARTRGSIEKLLTRSSKTSYGTKSLVSSGPHFFSVPDSVDDILCSRMSFGTLPTAFILSFPAFHFTPTRYSKSSHDLLFWRFSPFHCSINRKRQ